MPLTNHINLQLKSFAHFDDAMAMGHLLSNETGVEYTVMSDNHLGFTVKRGQEKKPGRPQKAVAGNARNRLEKMAYRQSLRGFIEHLLELVVGVFLIVSPYTVLGWVFAVMDVKTIPEWFSLPVCGEIFKVGGYLFLMYGLRFVYSYYAAKLFFEEDSMVLKKGIIAQDHIQIRFVDIKTVGVRQSIIERLLNIGTLHLASAGTNGEVDIIFDNLISPAYMRNRVQKLIVQNTRH
jgi:membrane protein YdbS with pleckstrin-like domain